MITAMPRIAIATSDFDGIRTIFRNGFGLPLVDLSASSVDSLGAKLAMCVPEGGSNIELMSPADPTAPLSQSLARFLDRRGEGLFALMLEAPDPNAEAEALSGRGLHVLPLMAGAGGRDIHPRSTHGVLIRVYPDGSFQAPPGQIDREAAADLGLSGIARVIIAVGDLDRARDVYGHGLGLPVDAAAVDRQRGVAAAICRPPAGGIIELVSVTDASRPFAAAVAAQLASRGEGMFALVLEAADPGAVGAQLRARGVSTTAAPGDDGAVLCDAVFGARILIEPA
jgi:catechol 2,3-dioxygenase-like lactoylglutathione lyase family enzyme